LLDNDFDPLGHDLRVTGINSTALTTVGFAN